MAKQRLNSLDRFRKQPGKLILEEHGSCEVPAGTVTPVGPASTLSTGNPSAPAPAAAASVAAPMARNTATRPDMTSSLRHGPVP